MAIYTQQLPRAEASEGSEQTKHWRGKPLFTNNCLPPPPPMFCLLRGFRRPWPRGSRVPVGNPCRKKKSPYMAFYGAPLRGGVTRGIKVSWPSVWTPQFCSFWKQAAIGHILQIFSYLILNFELFHCSVSFMKIKKYWPWQFPKNSKKKKKKKCFKWVFSWIYCPVNWVAERPSTEARHTAWPRESRIKSSAKAPNVIPYGLSLFHNLSFTECQIWA